jgi:hypothetical protein
VFGNARRFGHGELQQFVVSLLIGSAHWHAIRVMPDPAPPASTSPRFPMPLFSGAIRMDAQDMVLDRYPDADAREEPPIFRHGEATPVERGYWGIFAGPDLDIGPLGSGNSESRAWEDAAHRLGNARNSIRSAVA